MLGLPTKRQPCPVNGHGLLHMSEIACRVVQGYVQLSYGEATVASDITSPQLWYISERQPSFPGVTVQQIYQRTYPFGDVASQVLGIVSRITGPETLDPYYKGVNENDSVGQSGLEASYDRYLRGVDGAEKVKVDAFGNFVGVQSQTAPTAGDNLKLSLNAKLEEVGQQALQQSIDTNYPANGGAFVAMNPDNGQIYAMGSLPTYNANVFTKPVPTRPTTRCSGPTPATRRSTAPTRAPARPARRSSRSPPPRRSRAARGASDSIFDDTGQFCFSGQCRHNAGNAVDGSLDLVNAIKVSSDDFFYNLGVLTNSPAPNGGPLQKWARKYGIGQKTGIDLPDESSGTLPDAAWRSNRNQLEAECDSATGPFKYTNGVTTGPKKLKGWHRSQKHPPGGCGIADGTDRPWSAGDNENLAVGQGDVQVTPLQLAVVYSALANGGTIVTPHMGLDVQSADGFVLRSFNPAPKRHIDIDPLYRDTILAGLRAGSLAAGRNLGRRVRQLPRAGLRQDRHRAVQRPAGLRLVRLLRPAERDEQADRGRGDRRAGRVRRGRRGAGGAPDPLAVVLRQQGRVRAGELADAMSSVGAHAIRPADEVAAAPRPRMWLRMDPLLLLAALGLAACSVIMLKGEGRSLDSANPMYFAERQAIYFGIGLVLALVLAHFDYSRLREYKYGLYGVMIALNMVVLGMPRVQGAARWIPLPFFQLQPSEFGKVLLIVAVSAFAVDRSRRLHERRTTARIMLLALIPAMIVIPQPDLGTALVYVAVGFAILFFAGTSWKQLTGLAVLFVVAIVLVLVVAPATGHHLLKPYQMQRLTGFLHPSHDPGNQTYNITESLTAIGSGGKTGLGTAGASQVNLHFLPAPSTDFIFAVVGETYGFVGAAVVLSLYALLIWRALRILTMSKNLYGTLIAGGILAMLMFQVFVNAGMTIGIMPITGVPLPLLSYGGSSVLVTFIAIGLLQSICVQARMTAATKTRGLVSS